MRSNGKSTQPAVAAICAVMLLAGCASGGPTELLAARPEPVKPDGPLVSAVRSGGAAIEAIDVEQTDEAARIVISTSEPLVWTTYRDEAGSLVVELPNSTPSPELADHSSASGLVSAVNVTNEAVGSRPLTRLVIETRSASEHSVSAAQEGLRVELGTADALAAIGTGMMPSEPAMDSMDVMDTGDTMEMEPVAEVAEIQEPVIEDLDDAWEGAAVEVEDLDEAATDTRDAVAAIEETTVWESEAALDDGTQAMEAVATEGEEATWIAQAPEMADTLDAPEAPSWDADATTAVEALGVPATELRNIDVMRIDDSVVVRILGDGEFSYETLVLESPYRYVIDLAGVANFAPQSTYAFSDQPVEQIRVAQFKSQPMPVARVVVDLAYPTTPELVGLPDGLALSFGGATAASWEETESSTLWEDVSTTDEAADVAAGTPTTPVTEVVEAPGQVYEEVPAAYEDLSLSATMPEEEVVTQVAQYVDSGPAQDPMVDEDPVVEDYEAAQEPAPMVEEPYEAPMPSAPESMPAPINVQFAPEPMDEDDPTELFNSTKTPAGGQKVYRGVPVTLRLKDADIRDLLRSFSEFSGLNFVIQPGVRGTVTVELTDVPWDQALDLILKTNDLGYELEGNILRIAPLAKLRAEAEEEQRLRTAQAQAVPLAFVIKRVSYADANAVARVLQSGSNSVMSQRGSVIVDARTNTLIIKELPNFIDTVIAVIETLDIPEPQVMIEARIIETTKRFSRTLGINWGFDGIASPATGNTTGLVFPNQGTITGGVDVSQAGTGTLGVTLGNVLNTFQLDVALQAAESDGLINILSAPKITTLNNESASIQSGLQIPIQTLSNNTVSVQFVNATLQLQVTPHVTAEGTVLMDISIQKREPLLAFAVQGAANAPISTKDAKTRVIVRDGGTTVIGGIYEVTSDEGQDKVPGLSRVPLLKHLFKNNRQSEENEELLIFITPRVVNL